MKINTFKASVFLVIAVLSLGFTPAYATAGDSAGTKDPQPVLAQAIDSLIDRLSENADEIQQDLAIAYDISDELIAPHIDFPRITRLVIGKYWRRATQAQREQLVEEIRELMIRSYVTAMVSYVDQIVAQKNRINYLPSRYTPGDSKASVRAGITLDTGQNVEVQYQLYRTLDMWKIYDIRIEGISLAISYRTTFGDKIQRDGLDGLITQLQERNRKGEVELPSEVVSETP